MNKHTVKVVALIGTIVREDWPGAQKSTRLGLIKKALIAIEEDFINLKITHSDKQSIQITLDLTRDELIVITIDGDLGVYYPNSDSSPDQGRDNEPIRTSLLKTRTVQIVKTYQVEVPVTGSESLTELFSLSNDYKATLIDIKLKEEIK